MKSFIFLAIGFATFLISCNSQETLNPNNASPTIPEIVSAYAVSYEKVTDKEVLVNPELAMLCRGANQQDIDKARIKNGPHAYAAILVYMNNLATVAFDSNSASYPVGSVIIKQKKFHPYWMDNGKLGVEVVSGVCGMVKRPVGYDPEHGDWEYFYFNDSQNVESGKISSCILCHASTDARDHVFGSWRTK